ncbi:MAG: hypothetical protein MZW92_04825 [Comamonadaceae bacterium]|nr:hypothetical protein [Comamonadaceae bacterium]
MPQRLDRLGSAGDGLPARPVLDMQRWLDALGALRDAGDAALSLEIGLPFRVWRCLYCRRDRRGRLGPVVDGRLRHRARARDRVAGRGDRPGPPGRERALRRRLAQPRAPAAAGAPGAIAAAGAAGGGRGRVVDRLRPAPQRRRADGAAARDGLSPPAHRPRPTSTPRCRRPPGACSRAAWSTT